MSEIELQPFKPQKSHASQNRIKLSKKNRIKCQKCGRWFDNCRACFYHFKIVHHPTIDDEGNSSAVGRDAGPPTVEECLDELETISKKILRSQNNE